MAQRPRVAIVGGGIGGLFAANALLAHDIPAAVYEQAPAIGEVGAGVFLTPNSVRHLQRVGLGPAVEKSGARVGSEFALLPPRRRADRAGAGDGLLGLERDLRHAPRRPRRHAGQRPARGHGSYRTSLHRFRAGRRHGAGVLRQWRFRRGRSRDRGRRHPLGAPAGRPSAVAAGIFRIGRLSRPGAARARSALADRPLADVARQGQALPRLSRARRKTDQLCRVRADGRGDEGIMVGARRSRRAAAGVCRLGSAHPAAVAAKSR